MVLYEALWSGREYVTLVEDMYENSKTVEKCALVTYGFKVEVGLHQGSALRPLLFAMVIGRLSAEIRQVPLWTMIFADDSGVCTESMDRVEENLERW